MDKEKVERYRTLALLVTCINRAYAPIAVPTGASLLVGNITLAFVGACRIDDANRYSLAISAITDYATLLILFRTAAHLNTLSLHLLRKWRVGLPNRSVGIQHRILRTLRELRINIRSFGYVDTTLILTLSGIILDNSIDFLIFTRIQGN